jgi:hypothetical protein
VKRGYIWKKIIRGWHNTREAVWTRVITPRGSSRRRLVVLYLRGKLQRPAARGTPWLRQDAVRAGYNNLAPRLEQLLTHPRPGGLNYRAYRSKIDSRKSLASR